MLANANIAHEAQRVEKAAKALNPSCVVKFDPQAQHNHLRFSVWIGDVLATKAYPDIHVDKIAEMSDEQLQVLLRQLSSGLL
jgi:hypothetical protein